jgi:molecular chaperone GrpE
MRKRKQHLEEKNEETVEAKDLLEAELQEDESQAQDESLQDVEESAAESDDDGHLALVETSEAAIQRLTAEVEEQKERCLRLAAEFDNFRKRVERQRTENRQNARSEVVRSILETLDNLSRVTALDGTDASANDVIAGVQMVERGLMRELESAGLTKVGNVDDLFDPNDHEAVSTAAAPCDEKVDLVAAVFQVGYRFGSTLLRPARVQVYVAPMVDEDAGE